MPADSSGCRSHSTSPATCEPSRSSLRSFHGALAQRRDRVARQPVHTMPVDRWSRQRLCSAAVGAALARARLLGARHPLVRVMDDIRARVSRRSCWASSAASPTAALAGVAEARAAARRRSLVEVALACAWCSQRRQARPPPRPHHRRPGGSAAAPVARERERLLDRATARAGTRSRHCATRQRTPSCGDVTSPVPATRDRRGGARPRRDRAIAPVRGRGYAAVAMAERLLSRHDSPLYEEDAERLRVQLRRVRFLLDAAVTERRTDRRR